MKNYLLLGYNSGGYKDRAIISFDGTIDILFKPDPKYPNTPSTISYFHITHADESVTDENNEFLEKLINDERGYHESFLVCQIFEINKESFFNAIKEKDIYVVLNLIKAGIDIDIEDENGQTALHLMAKESNFLEFRELLKVGAKINVKNNKGETPLDIHIKHQNDKYFIEYLVEEGAIRGENF